MHNTSVAILAQVSPMKPLSREERFSEYAVDYMCLTNHYRHVFFQLPVAIREICKSFMDKFTLFLINSFEANRAPAIAA